MSLGPVQVLRLLIKLYESVEKPDWVSISQCLLLLDDAPEVAKVLERLLKGSEVSPLSPCCAQLERRASFCFCVNSLQMILRSVTEVVCC